MRGGEVLRALYEYAFNRSNRASEVERVRDEAISKLDCGKTRSATATEAKTLVAKKTAGGEHLLGEQTHAGPDSNRVCACAANEDIGILRLIISAKEQRVVAVTLIDAIDACGRKLG